MYCPTDYALHLSGSRDSKIQKEDHSYVIYEVLKCTEAVREELGYDKECRPIEEIDAWLEGKKLGFKVI